MGTGKRFGSFPLLSIGGPLNQKTSQERGFLEMELGGTTVEPSTPTDHDVEAGSPQAR